VTADAGSEIVHFAYGQQRRVVRIATTATTIDYSYDRAGEPVARSDGSSTIQYQYDRQRNLVRSADARGETVEYDYDGDGSLLRAITGGAATRFGYGADGRLVEARGSGGDTTTFSYAGALLQLVAPDVGDDVLVTFEQGTVDKPYVAGYVYGDAEGESFTLSTHGLLTGCGRCP
jgi:YD repeat-containing protein